MEKKVLVVTGASKGIGLQIVLAGLKAGYQVVGTSRNKERLTQEVQTQLPEFQSNFYAVNMPFDEEGIRQGIAEIIEKFGRIDYLVNNAGYALLGAVEEFSLSEVRTNFDVNFFGLFQVIQEVLPIMRKQQFGRIINMASISGSVTGPTQGVYSATKAAVIMLSEALNEEVRPFNIQVTAICPGGVRTDFLDQTSMKRPDKQIEDYDVVRQTMSGFDRLNHNQSGDPVKVAQAIIAVTQMEQAPGRLYLGVGALAALQHQINHVVEEVNQNVALSQSTEHE